MLNAPANYPGQAIDPIRVSQVQNELDAADKGLTYLQENLVRLRGRLNSVLRPQPPQPEKTCNPPKAMLVPLAEALSSRNEALTQSNQMLEDILELLDL